MEKLLEVSKITKRFEDLVAVDEVSFSMIKGEIFGLFGPNGAGKSTLIQILLGLLKYDSGEIHFLDELRDRHKIGYCPQENILYPRLTCREQLEFFGKLYGMSNLKARSRALLLLDQLGLTDKADVLAEKLSGGMKRRLNIALALVHQPELLILDEPEAGLDPQSRILVREYIHSLRKEMTILLTTHNMDEADRLVDRLAIMDFGKILRLDTASRLKVEITTPERPNPTLEDVFISLTGRTIRE